MNNKKNIWLMYAIVLLQGMVFYGPIATLYRQAQGLTVFQITLIESISYILCILCEVPWGIIADRIGYKKTMCFCCCLYLVRRSLYFSTRSNTKEPACLFQQSGISISLSRLPACWAFFRLRLPVNSGRSAQERLCILRRPVPASF